MIRLTPKSVDEAIAESAGEEVLPLIKVLKKKRNTSEFELAEKIKKEVNVTRNLLYRLYDVNLVSFERIKDKKKGWYVYYWSFNENKIRDLVTSMKKKKLDRLKDRLTREKNNKFYSCCEKCLRLDFEQAFDFEFKCPECGELLEEEDNTKKIKEIEEEIKTLEKELKEPIRKIIEPKPTKEVKKSVDKKSVKTAKKKIIKKKTTKSVKKSSNKTKKATKKKEVKKKTTKSVKKKVTKKTTKKKRK